MLTWRDEDRLGATGRRSDRVDGAGGGSARRFPGAALRRIAEASGGVVCVFAGNAEGRGSAFAFERSGVCGDIPSDRGGRRAVRGSADVCVDRASGGAEGKSPVRG